MDRLVVAVPALVDPDSYRAVGTEVIGQNRHDDQQAEQQRQ